MKHPECSTCVCRTEECEHKNLRGFVSEDGEPLAGCPDCGQVFIRKSSIA